jgi:hypothetical protein
MTGNTSSPVVGPFQDNVARATTVAKEALART